MQGDLKEKQSYILAKACLFWALLICLQPGLSSANTALFKARCYSFAMHPASTSEGETIYFTTYDGLSGVPLHDEKDGLWYFNSEILPITLGGSEYVVDFLVANSLGIYAYGAAGFSSPNTDSNNNGFPDVLEVQRSASASFSGSSQQHYNYYGSLLGSTITGTLTRSSNNRIGSYSGSFSNITGTASVNGTWEVFHASGSVNYTEDTIDFTVSLTTSSSTDNFSGTAAYTPNGSDQIIINAFDLASTSGSSETVRVYSSTLNRYGKYYRGNVQVDDGNSSISWRDYYNWQFEIKDNNDWDGDGIPDLTDPPVTVLSISISGNAKVNEGTSNTYTCTANYSDGTSMDVTSSVTWSVIGEAAGSLFNGNTLVAGDVNSNTTITIQAQYTFRGVKNKTMNVLVKDLKSMPWLQLLLDDD